MTDLLAPLILGAIACAAWAYYARAQFIAASSKTLLELLPGDGRLTGDMVSRVLLAFHQTARGRSIYARFFRGAVRPVFSLEMTSGDGGVRYFIFTETAYQSIVEAAIQDACPGARLRELADYATETRIDPAGNADAFYGFECVKVPAEAASIQTYETAARDPLSALHSFLSSSPEGERLWVQILIRGARAKGTDDIQFDTSIRALMIAPRGTLQKSRIIPFQKSFEAFSVQNRANIIISRTTDVRYLWHDVRGIRARARRARFYNAYVRRSAFYPPHVSSSARCSRREIATLFHIPAPIPTLPAGREQPSAFPVPVPVPTPVRATAPKATHRPEPPANLPV